MKILTFDLEDWFNILEHPETSNFQTWGGYQSRLLESTQSLLDLLEDKKQKATFFCLGWVAEKHPSLIRSILEAGHELGSHSYGHQLVYCQDRKEFQRDLYQSISILEDISGKKITAYRAPGFSVTKESTWVFDVLIEAGITHDCSIFPMRRAHGGFPGAPSQPFILETNGGEIKAFPMNIYRFAGRNFVFSGGGYFRLLNYSLIKYFMSKSGYVMTYFHPRDFDINQPMIPGLSVARQFKSYVGIKGAFAKLEKLIDDFDFYDLRTADKEIEWHNLLRFKV